ncbi:NLRC3, partial [Symbiodinium sp. CCMP2456]
MAPGHRRLRRFCAGSAALVLGTPSLEIASFADFSPRAASSRLGPLRRAAASAEPAPIEELLPVGPFCPFASPRLKNLCADERHRSKMEDIVTRIDRLAEVEDASSEDHLVLSREIR